MFNSFHAFFGFFKLTFSKKIFQEYPQSVEQFGSRSGLTFFGPDLCPNYFQRILADYKVTNNGKRVKTATKTLVQTFRNGMQNYGRVFKVADISKMDVL